MTNLFRSWTKVFSQKMPGMVSLLHSKRFKNVYYAVSLQFRMPFLKTRSFLMKAVIYSLLFVFCDFV